MFFSFTGISLLFIVLLKEGSCTGIVSWNMNLFCGTGFSRNISDYAGEVYYDAEYFSGRVDKCSLTITPATWNDYGGNMVMFYFTTFEFQAGCDMINVSVKDGVGKSARIVKGLPRFICGVNSSLTEQIFSTSGGSLQLQVHVNLKKNWNKYRGHFRLKFITYHTGSCYDSSSHQCSNGHCIPYLYNCSESIKACGEQYENCKTEDTNNEISGFGNIIKYFLIFVACVCIIWVLKALGKEAKQKCRNATHIEDSCRNIRLKCSSCCRTINLSRFPKPRLPQFIRNRLHSNSTETADDRSTTEAVDNTGFSDDESQIDQVHVVETQIRNTGDITQTDIGPPSYEEAMTTSTYPYPSLQPEEPAPLYEEVISENPVSSALQFPDYTSDAPNLSMDTNDNAYLNETYNDTNTEIMTSDAIPELDTSSILNLYLNDFAVELSDNYSTDTDWDSQSDSTVLSADRISVTQSVQNESDTRHMIASAYETQTVSGSDWDSDGNGSVLSPEHEAVTNESNMVSSDWDSDSNSSVLSVNQSTVPEATNIVLDTQTVLAAASDWGSDINSSVSSLEEISVRQSIQTEGDTQNVLDLNDLQRTEDAQSESDIINAPRDYTEQDMASGYDDGQDLPISPPNYDEAVPPPYYYDYIANVGRYK